MSGFLKSVDQRTQLAGMNRMELLLFKLNTEQIFGINVFKVREVINTPHIATVPRADIKILGVSDIRGATIPMIDLGLALGEKQLYQNQNNTLTIVTEFNSSIQGFIVRNVQRIVHLRWADILPPPETLHHVNFLTGLTRVDNEIVEIVDVEKVLSEVAGNNDHEIDAFDITKVDVIRNNKYHVLVADDSAVARGHLRKTLEKIGVNGHFVNNGKEALEKLLKWAQDAKQSEAPRVADRLLMIISDIEMPEMDGYTLTTNIRRNDDLKDLYVILNSSLSGGFNDSLTEKVGANLFLSKWHKQELVEAILERIDQVEGVV